MSLRIDQSMNILKFFSPIELIEDKLRIFDNWTRIEILNFCILTLLGNTEKHPFN